MITGWVENEVGEAQVMIEALGRYNPRSMERLKWFSVKNIVSHAPYQTGLRGDYRTALPEPTLDNGPCGLLLQRLLEGQSAHRPTPVSWPWPPSPPRRQQHCDSHLRQSALQQVEVLWRPEPLEVAA